MAGKVSASVLALRVFCWGSLTALLLFRCEETLASARSGLSLAGTRVIPALFPISVLSILTVGAAETLFRSIPGRKMSGLSALLVAAVGLFCGFPLGARCLSHLRQDGFLSEEQARRLFPLAHNTGPAFLLGTAGVSLLGSKRAGLWLFLIQLVTALFLFLLLSAFSILRQKKDASRTLLPFSAVPARPPEKTLTGAIAASALSMTEICGYTVFFHVLSDAVRDFLLSRGVPQIPAALSPALFEISGGCAGAAGLAALSPRLSFAGMAFAVCWAGLSVHAQAAAFFPEDRGFGRRCLTIKLTQGILAFWIGYLLYPALSLSLVPASTPVSSPAEILPPVLLFLSGTPGIFLALIFTFRPQNTLLFAANCGKLKKTGGRRAKNEKRTGY